jgi:polyhydroxyalkanoate synthase
MRPDLIRAEEPPAFDLLYWNSDGTRMARAAHGWYLRNTYVENNLVQPGKVHLKGDALDLGRIRQDIYAVGAEKDHIVPWDAAFRITQLSGGKVRFVLASSGHIAGIINPPGGKGTYWTNKDGQRRSPFREDIRSPDGARYRTYRCPRSERRAERNGAMANELGLFYQRTWVNRWERSICRC